MAKSCSLGMMGVPVMNNAALNVLRFIFFVFLLQIIQTFQLIVASPLLHSYFQRRLTDDYSGFISIDCGSTAASYLDNKTGLNYTFDEKYVSTGINMNVSTSYYGKLPSDLFKTVRSFPYGRKNCYRLSPLKPNNKYLIRAQFMYGNFDSKNSVPVFDVYIGVNLWFTVTLVNQGSHLIQEIIHVATTVWIDVCLIKNQDKGSPFISVLELRPLDESSYPVASPYVSLALRHREDSGGPAASNGPQMVNDDSYNRLWYKYPDCGASTAISTAESFDASQANPFKVPTSVLSTACEQNNTNPNMLVSHKLNDPTPIPHVYAYWFWYFAELQVLGSDDTREFDISVPSDQEYNPGPIIPKYLQVTTFSSRRISLNGSTSFRFTLTKTSRSNLYPIINAYEFYYVVNLTMSPTNQQDTDAVSDIKDKYAVTRIWQGDPCLPVNYQWDGLSCKYDANNPPRITSLNLSWSNLSGELPSSLSKLTSLTSLDLSNNVLTGQIPEFLANLNSLHDIDLSRNNLTGPVPRALADKASNGFIVLRLAGNPYVCNSYPCYDKLVAKKKKHPSNVGLIVVVCIACVSLLVIIGGIIFVAFKRTKKQAAGSVDGAIRQKTKQFKYSEIVRITDSFRKVLGKGGFGTVYYGVLRDGTQVAVKVLNHTSSTIIVKQFRTEAELLTRTHHVNLVSLIGYCDEHAKMALVYEYMSYGDLQAQLSEKNEHPLCWKARLEIAVDAAQGLEYLHSGCRPPIIHRDIKPANILLDETGRAKIADFGLSRFFTTDSQGAAMWTDLAGTRGYLDPEYCQPINTLSEKSDVYAYGIVLLQLLTGQPTIVNNTNYQDEDDTEHIVDWVSPKVESGDIMAIIDKRLQGDLIVNSAWKFLEIAMECVKPRGNDRPTMTEVVVNLKACSASEGFHYQNVADGVGEGNHIMNSSQPLESIVSLPIAR